MKQERIIIELLSNGFVAFCKVKQLKDVVEAFRGKEELVVVQKKLRLK